jgi:hypothetical protein
MTGEQAVIWMAKHGHPGYANEIQALEATKWETIGEAGRYWQLCPFTHATIMKIQAEIAEVQQVALDRYEDWASDPLD